LRDDVLGLPSARRVERVDRLEDAAGAGTAAQGSRSEVAEERALPAWSLPPGAADQIRLDFEWPERVTREWALEGATGKGVRVCILDSGVEADHPQVGKVNGAVAISVGEDGEPVAEPDEEGDLCGHGTACA